MAGLRYVDFDLLIDRGPEGYRVRVLNSPAGQASAEIRLPYREADLEGLLATFGRPAAVAQRDARPPTHGADGSPFEQARTFGEDLFNAVFEGEVRSSLHRSLDEADRQGAGLRLRLRLGEVPELAYLPWEYLYDPTRERFLVLSAETPVVRYMDLPERVEPLRVEPPLRILVMIASPSGYPELEVEQEWEHVKEAMAELKAGGLVALDRMEEATLSALQRRLRRGEHHVFHFIGHGAYDSDAEEGVLLLEEGSGEARATSGGDLGMLLHDHRPLRLVTLNACEGARASREDPFAGTAQNLVQQGIPAVIAMQFPVSDQAAITFARELYGAVADGFPIDAGLSEARKAIFAQAEGAEWGKPVLYMRSPDGQLFEMARKPQPGAAKIREGEPRAPRRVSIQPDLERVLPEQEGAVGDILEKLAQARLVLFVGADVLEAEAGLPERQSLADALAARHGIETGLPLSRVAQQVMRGGNRWEFTHFLLEALDPAGRDPGAFYTALASLVAAAQPALSVTTAYHRLFERALDAQEVAFNVVAQDSALAFAAPDRPTLLKLYGDLQQVESMVVTEQDLNALLRGREKGEMVEEVRRAFRRKSVLFLAYDLADPAVGALFDEVAGDRFQMNSYAVWSGLGRVERESYQSNRNLTVLEADPVGFLHSLLDALG